MYPEILTVGPLHLRSWGLMIAIGFSLVLWLVTRSAQRSGLMTADDVMEGGMIGMLSGLFGSRIAHVIEYWQYYKNNWLEIVMVQHGGMVFYGGLLLAMATLGYWCFRKKLNPLKVLDLTAPAFLVGIGVGRIGCFLNGCCYGRVTTHPWGMHFPNIAGTVHPTQLYETMATLLGAGLAYMLSSQLSRPGQQLGLCMVFYGILRFAIETLRVNPLYGDLSSAQWISIILCFVGLIFLMRPSLRKANHSAEGQ